MAQPLQLHWDYGTAYDFFQSVKVLYQPARFGVRGAWTAGMRARLRPDARRILERSQLVIHPPVHWIYKLPSPKDAHTALEILGRIPPRKRLETLAFRHDDPPPRVADMLRQVANRGAWDKGDLAALRNYTRTHHHQERGHATVNERLTGILDTWAQTGTFGEGYLAALHNYYEVFFAEEEERIMPALQAAISRAQVLAKRLSLPDLLEELSQGIRVEEPRLHGELIFIPSYWITPLMLMTSVAPARYICLFGARPAGASLIPGETVPDTLLRALKALSDPTRLKILRYLVHTPLTTTELARRLRLRTPTVMHHLHALRLAGLVQVIITPGAEDERKRYALRPRAPVEVGKMLATYLEEGGTDKR